MAERESLPQLGGPAQPNACPLSGTREDQIALTEIPQTSAARLLVASLRRAPCPALLVVLAVRRPCGCAQSIKPIDLARALHLALTASR
jgi:hypothetical protein